MVQPCFVLSCEALNMVKCQTQLTSSTMAGSVHDRCRLKLCRLQAVRGAVSIPVLANGNIRHLQDVHDCIAYTGVQGVMSAESLLEDPALFWPHRLQPGGVWPGMLDLSHCARLCLAVNAACLCGMKSAETKPSLHLMPSVLLVQSRCCHVSNNAKQLLVDFSSDGFSFIILFMTRTTSKECSPTSPHVCASALTGAYTAIEGVRLLKEYLDLAEQFSTPMRMVRGHTFGLIGQCLTWVMACSRTCCHTQLDAVPSVQRHH